MRDGLPSEHKEQTDLVSWWNEWGPKHGYPEQALFAIPNGGLRNPRTCAMLKQEGVRAGVPDLFLALKGGLWIEMKRRQGGIVSTAQTWFHLFLWNQGFHVRVCHGSDEARRAILKHLGAEE